MSQKYNSRNIAFVPTFQPNGDWHLGIRLEENGKPVAWSYKLELSPGDVEFLRWMDAIRCWAGSPLIYLEDEGVWTDEEVVEICQIILEREESANAGESLS